MIPRHSPLANERGVAVYLIAVLLVMLMSIIGMAVDLGRGYIVRNALATAVDGAALAAARALPQGTGPARTAAEKIFNTNFPTGFLGVSSVTAPSVDFGSASDGSSLITVRADAVLPTTFMRVAGNGYRNLNVSSSGQATRRLVDMSFVIDRSGSLNSVFGAVRAASSDFIGKFDDVYDRVSLVSFSNNVRVHSAIVQPGRGFAKSTIQSQINALVSRGNTSTAEGLYQAWNQLKLVPLDNQSSLRVIVLFTDGSPNAFAASIPQGSTYGVANTCAGNVHGGGWTTKTGTIISSDVQAGDLAEVQGLWDTYTTSTTPDNVLIAPTNGTNWTSGQQRNFTTVDDCIPRIPTVSIHTPQQGTASGIPTSFPLFDNTLPAQRGLIGCAGTPIVCPNHVQNANNAARNLSEVIANRIRMDTTGAARIHIFTLGLGNELTQGNGAGAERGDTMLRRISNDPASGEYDPTQPEGAYFFAGSVDELGRAFEAIRDRIVRISQ